MKKYIPTVGEHLYLRQRTGNMWIDEVKRPYTVISVTEREVTVQACKLIFNGPVYYDSIADDIQENPDGRTVVLVWSSKKNRWQEKGKSSCYPQFAVFGRWEHQPYLN